MNNEKAAAFAEDFRHLHFEDLATAEAFRNAYNELNLPRPTWALRRETNEAQFAFILGSLVGKVIERGLEDQFRALYAKHRLLDD